MAGADAGRAEEDDTLVVLFMCCHPALTPASAIALTLRAVGGLTTAQVARAFLVPEATMAQRISRAKGRITASGVPFRMPSPDERRPACASSCGSCTSSSTRAMPAAAGAELHRAELSDEAIRLARMARRLLPDDPEVAGLLALMLLIDARRPARTTADGAIVPLAEQDRARWDATRIAEGLALLDGAIASGRVGEYQVQAAIAAIHDGRRAPRTPTGRRSWPCTGCSSG